ncbi:MAG TPA: hypothetical protein VMG81_02940 [Thermoplasmata archaeon]|nr:hypothetical protein [Thermoplasmata archaeon]
MVRVSLRYQFRQPFRVPAAAAFAWATDFRPTDAAIFGDRRTRSVRRLAPDTVVMTDTTFPDGRRVRIDRLVRVFPEARAWTNTHLSGPYRYSQFWYRIVPDGPRRSHLEFHGLQLTDRPRALTPAELRRESEAVRRSDAATWRQKLGPALERALAAPRP